ncbi:MAG TPA: secretion system protein, partial [Lentzea sp.]
MTTVITSVVLGSGLGVGLWALAVWAVPPRPPLRVVLARITAAPAATPILVSDDASWVARLGRPAVAPLLALGLPGDRLIRDLAVVGRPVSTHLAEKAVFAASGVLLPALLHLLLA